MCSETEEHDQEVQNANSWWNFQTQPELQECPYPSQPGHSEDSDWFDHLPWQKWCFHAKESFGMAIAIM